MKNLVRHLANENMSEIAAKSIMNCHCIGVHSIMLVDTPGKTIRLYVAEKGNELYKNKPNSGHQMTVAFHPHHCNITIEVAKGTLFNWVVNEKTDEIKLDKFTYSSKIKAGEITFNKVGSSGLHTQALHSIRKGQAVLMSARSIHTVYCSSNEVTAWFVYEGKEDPEYKPYAWSNADLSNTDFSGLYKAMSDVELVRILSIADLI